MRAFKMKNPFLAKLLGEPKIENSKNGDLGWFKKGRMVKSFDEAAFNASKNQIIGPVESKFGYHVIFVRDTRLDSNMKKKYWHRIF